MAAGSESRLRAGLHDGEREAVNDASLVVMVATTVDE